MKQIKKIRMHLKSPFYLGLMVTCGIAYVARTYYVETSDLTQHSASLLNGFIREIHEKTIDWRMRIRGERPGSDRVAILAVDERSIELEGRWPWPREKTALLVDRAIAAGAKSVSFDMIFSEEDNTSSVPALEHLRRTLQTQGKLPTELDAVVGQEMARSNGDLLFSQVLQKNADHLVMGSYPEVATSAAGMEHPYRDLCIDSIFQASFPGFVWGKENIKFKVSDIGYEKLRFPDSFREGISLYVTLLQVKAATDWIAAHPKKVSEIRDAFFDLGGAIPEETYPGVAVVWINNDFNKLISLLEQIKPAMANREGVSEVFRYLKSGFTEKEKADLGMTIRKTADNYCDRFLTPQDDLLSFENYSKYWKADQEQHDQFDQISWPATWAALQAADPSYKAEPFDHALVRLRTDALPNSIGPNSRSWVNIPQLAFMTHHTGSFEAIQDKDGSIRRSPVVRRIGNSYIPSLPFKTFLLDQNYQPAFTLGVAKFNNGSQKVKSLGKIDVLAADGKKVLSLPTDPRGDLMINYSGPRNMFPYISAADILSDEKTMVVEVKDYDPKTNSFNYHEKTVDKASFMKDKVLLLGATAVGAYDLRVTPFDENVPGVETHANVLSNLLVENARALKQPVNTKALGFLRTSPAEGQWMWMSLLVIGILLTALLSWVGSVSGLLITAGALVGVFAIDNFVIFSNGIVITSVFPVFLILSDFVTLTFYKYFTEEKTKRALKGTFEKYVSPSIVAEVLADPSNIELGGKKMELTVMFSDVRGFTTISEKLDPRALSDLLNSYLTPMTNLVFANKGTLDKYMGDAIMAFWGAPIHFKDHAAHACRCALQMITELKLLQAAYRAKGLPEIDIGIGLNTGDMSVGNMGSDTVRSYTVMGDAVNLGSRLEGINKQYGTRIIISEFTHAAVKDTFVTRELDWVRVKGKVQPVRIFELVSEQGKADAVTLQMLECFNQGFLFYHERDFAQATAMFTSALNHKPDDAPSQLYLERCQDYALTPPEANWDGVFTMTSK